MAAIIAMTHLAIIYTVLIIKLLYIVRQRWWDSGRGVAIAPAVSDILYKREKCCGVILRNQFHARILEVRQSLEIIRKVSAHFKDPDALTLNLYRLGQMLGRNRRTLGNGGLGQYFTRFKEVFYLAKNPGTTVCRAPYHYTVHTMKVEHCTCLNS